MSNCDSSKSLTDWKHYNSRKGNSSFWNRDLWGVYRKTKRKIGQDVEGREVTLAPWKVREFRWIISNLWTFKVMYPFPYLILSACLNTIYFLLQGGKTLLPERAYPLQSIFSITWPCSEVKMTNLWHHHNFFSLGTNCEATNTGWWLHCRMKQSSWLERKEGSFLFKHTYISHNNQGNSEYYCQSKLHFV